MNDFYKEITEIFKGYHVDLMFYPSGGNLIVTGCEECQTDDKVMEYAIFGDRQECKTLKDAVIKVKERLENET